VSDVASRRNENVEPDYPSRETLAKRLDCAPSTIDGLVERGVLPRPIHLTPSVVRWRWLDVDVAIQALNSSDVEDPFIAGLKNVDFKKKKNRD
jgi:predicted DNA-binding transcriptional regulator AlpA